MGQKLLCLLARGNGGVRSAKVLIQGVGGDPTAHHHHRHARPGVCCPSRQVQALQVGTGIGWFEGARPTAVTRDAVDRSIQDLITIVNIDRRERTLKDDALFNVDETSSSFQLVENHLPISGKHLRPIVFGAQERRVHQHVERIPPQVQSSDQWPK
jgi:hypothetical protein